MSNRPECRCAAYDKTGYSHSVKCPVSQWEIRLDKDIIAKVIEDGDAYPEYEYIIDESDVVPEWIPDGDPNLWTELEWIEVSNGLDGLPADECEEWETVIFDRLDAMKAIEDETAVKDDECKCNPEKHKGIHSWDCPADEDAYAAYGYGGSEAWVDDIDSYLTSDTDKKDKKCTCKSENFGGIHTKTCPAYDGPKAATTWAPKCNHERGPKFKLAEGLEIGLVSWRDVEYVDDANVDIGVYMYESWLNGNTVISPGLDVPWTQDRLTKVVMLKWADYSAYTDLPHLKEVITWMLDETAKGIRFETGCMGGHGRTGTFAACLAIAADASVLPADAIERVRKEHCDSAVENDKQLDMIADFYKLWHGHQNWRGSKDERKRFKHLKGSKQSSVKTIWKAPASSVTTSYGAKGSPAYGMGHSSGPHKGFSYLD